MHDAMEELRKASADLATMFAQLMADTSHHWGPASQTFTTEVVLPEWSVDVAVLPPVESSNVTQPTGEGNAPASGNRNEILSTGGRLPLIQEGTTSVTSHGGRIPPAGGGPLPLSASGGNAPACGEVEAVSPSTRQTRAEHADSNIGMKFAAHEGFECSDFRWIIHPRSGERLWAKNREESTRIKKLWSEEPQESHHSPPASGGNAPARGNHTSTSSASGRYVPACGGGGGSTSSTRSVSFRSSPVVPSIAPPPGISRQDEYELLSRA